MTRPGYEDSIAGGCGCLWDCTHHWCGCTAHTSLLDNVETRPAIHFGAETRIL